MLGTLLEFGVSMLSGGATGIVGTAISGVIDLFQGRQKHNNELELRRLDIELANSEAAAAERVAAVQAEAERDKAEWEALEASYREASRRLSTPRDGALLQAADFIRAITRPGLTWALWALTAVIYFTVADAAMQAVIINGVLYVATAAGLWWFGAKQIGKMRGVK